jgi:cholesterol oxidase
MPDVVVIGSGFGGAVAAERLAKAGKTVLIIERGPRWKTTSNRVTLRNADGSLKPDSKGLYVFGQHYDPKYIYSAFKDYLAANMLVAETFGFGGGSLWYSNIAERAPSRIFTGTPAWPTGWDYTKLSGLYNRVATKITVRTPSEKPPRYQILRYAIEQIAGAGSFPLANIGVKTACVNCGWCTFGCFKGAKDSMMLNYLPAAISAGAQVLLKKEVVRIENRADGLYDVVYKDASFGYFVEGVKATGTTETKVTAKVVILAAGAIYTPVLLLKSKNAGFLPNLSSQVGYNLSGTGDYASGLVLPAGFSITFDGKTYSSVDGFKGRIIAGITRNLAASDGITIEDMWGPPIGVAAKFCVRLHDPSWADTSSDWSSTTNKVTKWKNPSLYGPRQKELVTIYPKRAVGIAFMGEDGNNGRVYLDASGNVAISRPTLTKYSTYQWWLDQLRSKLPAGTRFVETEHERRSGDFFASVHLLATCRMADSITSGVCNGNGQVFNYPNLYICDGSVVPRSTIVNPSQTILAVAEGICDYIVANFPP